MNTVINNAIIQSASVQPIILKSTSVKLTESNNYINTDVSVCGFVDYNGDDFHLQPSSPLIDQGANVLSYGIKFDFYNAVRPSGTAFDIGATEY
jgi:hypothetical protein